MYIFFIWIYCRWEDEMYENIIIFGELSNGIKDVLSDYFICMFFYEFLRVNFWWIFCYYIYGLLKEKKLLIYIIRLFF